MPITEQLGELEKQLGDVVSEASRLSEETSCPLETAILTAVENTAGALTEITQALIQYSENQDEDEETEDIEVIEVEPMEGELPIGDSAIPLDMFPIPETPEVLEIMEKVVSSLSEDSPTLYKKFSSILRRKQKIRDRISGYKRYAAHLYKEDLSKLNEKQRELWLDTYASIYSGQHERYGNDVAEKLALANAAAVLKDS